MGSFAETGRLQMYERNDPELGYIRGMDPWAVQQGMNLIRVDETCAEGFMAITAQNRQQYGTVHGGVQVAFADTVAGHSLVAQGRVCVTQGSTVNFLRPADGAYLTCIATPKRVGRHICVVSVETFNDREELVTTALFTFAVVKVIEPVLVPPVLQA